ncbi:helix-turn-helix domain-containing protein [Bradyrhizobium mercantei]|uniref:helix-turn-helix domain-containing protein n=1 Tax=Bradyrhizobium mercantei TaxID=1904807 RepID=UPI0009783D22|nr:AraC family transcriptional regulator [Bradyrhizobium mercantei]
MASANTSNARISTGRATEVIDRVVTFRGTIRYRPTLPGWASQFSVGKTGPDTAVGTAYVGSLTSNIAATLMPTWSFASAAQSVSSPSGRGLDRSRFARVLAYVESNLEGDISLDRLASIACLSRFHFARAFKQSVGQSPHRYVNARRLGRAKALLIEADRPLVDIAFALGFSSQANFARAFKQATGLAPGQFRREAQSRQRDPLLADQVRALGFDARSQRPLHRSNK